MGGLKNPDVLLRVVTKELGEIGDDQICVGVVPPSGTEVFKILGEYSFKPFPESSLCGRGLIAVFRPRYPSDAEVCAPTPQPE